MQRRTVLLVPGDERGWSELQRTLETIENVEIVGISTSGHDAIRLGSRLLPDVVLAAARLDGRSSLPMMKELRRECLSSTKIVIVATGFDPSELEDLAALGIEGHIVWSDLPARALREFLLTVIFADVFVVSRTIAEAFLRVSSIERPRNGARDPKVNERELRVLCALCGGQTHDEILASVPISRRTLERTVTKLYNKLGAFGAVELGFKASQLDLVKEASVAD